jgi:hypothetical protein
MWLGPALVALAAMLWGTDGLWRTGLINSGWPAFTIVTWLADLARSRSAQSARQG